MSNTSELRQAVIASGTSEIHRFLAMKLTYLPGYPVNSPLR